MPIKPSGNKESSNIFGIIAKNSFLKCHQISRIGHLKYFIK